MTEIDSFLMDADTIGISGHVRPDGDCVGSTLAVYNYIKDYSCGINVKPENVEDLMRGIKELIHMTDGERHDMGQRGHEAVLKYFNYDVLPLKFIDIMNQVLER